MLSTDTLSEHKINFTINNIYANTTYKLKCHKRTLETYFEYFELLTKYSDNNYKTTELNLEIPHKILRKTYKFVTDRCISYNLNDNLNILNTLHVLLFKDKTQMLYLFEKIRYFMTKTEDKRKLIFAIHQITINEWFTENIKNTLISELLYKSNVDYKYEHLNLKKHNLMINMSLNKDSNNLCLTAFKRFWHLYLNVTDHAIICKFRSKPIPNDDPDLPYPRLGFLDKIIKNITKTFVYKYKIKCYLFIIKNTEITEALYNFDDYYFEEKFDLAESYIVPHHNINQPLIIPIVRINESIEFIENKSCDDNFYCLASLMIEKIS